MFCSLGEEKGVAKVVLNVISNRRAHKNKIVFYKSCIEVALYATSFM
jgi:hypothetical protein